MPRSRGSDVPQRQQSPRVPLHLKTTACSESNGVVLRHSVERSPKLDEHRRSPRSPLPEKKRGARVADLETRLAQTQEELKKLKEQLASAEAAKRNAEQELEETKKQIVSVAEEQEQSAAPPKEATTDQEKTDQTEPLPAEDSINLQATFEVVPSASVETSPQHSDEVDSYREEEELAEEAETKAMIDDAKEQQESQRENPEVSELKTENPEISELNAKLVEMDRVIETLAAESEGLRKQVEEAKENVAACKTREEEMGVKLVKVEEELGESRAKAERLGEQLEAARGAQAAMEAEMKRMRVQTEQWRKAAEAAAAVLSTGEEEGIERRVQERCRSMDKHVGVGVGAGFGVAGFVSSPGIGGGGELEEEAVGGGKRKGGGGMRMFWKKSQK